MRLRTARRWLRLVRQDVVFKLSRKLLPRLFETRELLETYAKFRCEIFLLNTGCFSNFVQLRYLLKSFLQREKKIVERLLLDTEGPVIFSRSPPVLFNIMLIFIKTYNEKIEFTSAGSDFSPILYKTCFWVVDFNEI